MNLTKVISAAKSMGIDVSELIDNLEMLKTLNAEQEVIYKKLKEVETSNFNQYAIQHTKEQIWNLADINDKKKTISQIEKLEPILEVVDSKNKNQLDTFNILRVMTHTLEWNPNPGRLLKFIVKDKVTQKFLGVITAGSDFTTLGVRDEYIGLSDFHKFDMKKL